MHAAIYRRRPDVHAIARIDGIALAAWAARPEAPPLLHGFGGIVEPVAVWADPDLIADAETAGAVATALGDAPAVILRGNGGLAVGATLGEAAARAWCLEDRCAVAERAAGHGRPFSDEELARRSRWFDAETRRLWAWLQLTCADPA
jgi:HCOMODA/2-hydroxy-3-carboxy-muconic semialdehyde decarboxylase